MINVDPAVLAEEARLERVGAIGEDGTDGGLFAAAPAAAARPSMAAQHRAMLVERRTAALLADPAGLLLVADPPAQKTVPAGRGAQLATLPASATSVGASAYLYSD